MLKLGRRLTLATALAFLGCAATAQAAETIYGITGGATPSLVTFSSASPGTIESSKPILGLQPAETIRGIDVRPATGELMAVGSTGRLYRIDPGTGASTAIGLGGALTGSRFGVDFNPSVDRLRIVSDAEKNYRYNPVDGTLVGSDTDLAPPGEVVSVAYDRNSGGIDKTTLFALDSASDRLVRIGSVDGSPASPNGGAVTDVGPTGVDFAATAGFDVAGSDGTAYASLTVGSTTSLYEINLSTGAATKVADIGSAVIDVAVAQPKLTYYWSAASGVLVRGRTDAPVFETVIPISGLAGGEFIVGLDQRPATADLVALTNQDRLYLVDPATGSAAQIGTAPLTTPVGSVNVGVDFNPVADRIRAVADNETNLRLNPITGTLVAVDAPLTPAGDVTAAAYLNSFPGAATTVLYDLDAASNTLLRQDPPNNGVLTTLGALQSTAAGAPTLDIRPLSGFDIAPAGGFGFLLSRLGVGSNVHMLRVNLSDSASPPGGRIVDAGEISATGVDASGLAIMSPGLLTAGSTSVGEPGATAQVVVVRSGGRSGPVTVDYATANGTATAGQDYAATSGLLRFADGENAKVIGVPILDDSGVEGAETFSLMLSKPGGGSVLGPTAATVTITSEDIAPTGTPTPPPPVPDTTKPLGFVSITAGQSLRTLRSKGLKLKLVAGEPATATLSATITAATAKKLKLSSRRIATGKATFTAAGVKSLTLKLTKKAKSGLARSRKPVAVTAAAILTDAARNVTTTRGSAALPRR